VSDIDDDSDGGCEVTDDRERVDNLMEGSGGTAFESEITGVIVAGARSAVEGGIKEIGATEAAFESRIWMGTAFESASRGADD